MTAKGEVENRIHGLEIGADDYLPKPVDFNSLIKIILGDVEANSSVSDTQSSQVMSPERLEWEHIQHVLHRNEGNISQTARQLNMHRRTLQRKLQKKPVQH